MNQGDRIFSVSQPDTIAIQPIIVALQMPFFVLYNQQDANFFFS